MVEAWAVNVTPAHNGMGPGLGMEVRLPFPWSLWRCTTSVHRTSLLAAVEIRVRGHGEKGLGDTGLTHLLRPMIGLSQTCITTLHTCSSIFLIMYLFHLQWDKR